jgi:aryl-alcohol dehydrogenase (NADP+)
LLSGKYLHGKPENARVTLFKEFGQRYLKQNVNEAVAAYVEIAQKHQLSRVQLASDFV